MIGFGRISFYLLLTFVSVQGFSQSYSRADFKEMLSSFFNEKYNVIYIPSEFYDCGYDVYLNGEKEAFDLGYIIAQRCFPNYIDKMKFSDKGVKLMAEFGDAFVISCMKIVKDYESVLYTGKYCKCLQEQYVKYGIGFDHLSEPGFEDSEFYQKILQYCYSINER